MPTLKSKNRSESDSIRYVNLYKDDIENIIQIMKDGSDYINISDDKYNYESDTDFSDNRQNKADQLKIEAHGPPDNHFIVSCDCSNESIRISSFQSTPISRDIYRNVKELVESKSNFWLKLFREWIKIPIIITSFPLIFIFSSLFAMSIKYKHYSTIPLFSFLDIICMAFIVFSIKYTPSCRIYLEHNRGETFIFGKSKQEFMYDMFKMFMAAMLGSVITLLIKK